MGAFGIKNNKCFEQVLSLRGSWTFGTIAANSGSTMMFPIDSSINVDQEAVIIVTPNEVIDSSVRCYGYFDEGHNNFYISVQNTGNSAITHLDVNFVII